LRGLWINRRHSSDTTQEESSASSEENSTSENEDKIKDKILRASLPFVHEHGWTKHAISEGLKLQTDKLP
jgi:ubiquinone biosynthesis protein COQ9